MDTKKVTAEYRLSHWAQIIKRRNESGMTIKQFCESEGFPPRTPTAEMT